MLLFCVPASPHFLCLLWAYLTHVRVYLPSACIPPVTQHCKQSFTVISALYISSLRVHSSHISHRLEYPSSVYIRPPRVYPFSSCVSSVVYTYCTYNRVSQTSTNLHKRLGKESSPALCTEMPSLRMYSLPPPRTPPSLLHLYPFP